MHYFINLARNKLKFVCLKLCLTHVFDFIWRRGQPCRWLSGTNNWVRAHVGVIIIVWCNTHNNTEPNSIWFPATLTDTDLNIQGIQVKYRTNGNYNIPGTESRLWGTKWYYLFSAQLRMLHHGAFGIFYTKIFNWTFKNCFSRRGSSKGYWRTWPWIVASCTIWNIIWHLGIPEDNWVTCKYVMYLYLLLVFDSLKEICQLHRISHVCCTFFVFFICVIGVWYQQIFPYLSRYLYLHNGNNILPLVSQPWWIWVNY